MTAPKNKHEYKRSAESTTKQELPCTVEGCDYKTKKSGFAAQELGRHLKFVHGIHGKSSSAQKAQKEKQKSIAIGNTSTESRSEASNGQKRSYKKREAIADETPILIFIGKITAYCETEAKRYGVSEEYFVRRCAELFFASQVREKHRA